MHIKKSLINLKNRLSKTKYVKLILKFYKVDTVVICFHRVLDDNNFINQKRPDNNLVVSKSIFEKQIQYITKNFKPITIGNIFNDNSLTEKKIVITFDDGYKDNIVNALPILKKYNCPAIIYVTTGFLDNNNTAWWLKVWDIILNCKEIYFQKKKINLNNIVEKKKAYLFFTKKFYNMNIRDINKSIDEINHLKTVFDSNKTDDFISLSDLKKLNLDELIDIGCHTHMHQNLKILTQSDLYNEISTSKNILEESLNKKIKHFSIPFGTKKTYSSKVIKTLDKFGFETIVTTNHDIFNKKKKLIPRIGIGNEDLDEKLHSKLIGFDSLINKLLKR